MLRFQMYCIPFTRLGRVVLFIVEVYVSNHAPQGGTQGRKINFP